MPAPFTPVGTLPPPVPSEAKPTPSSQLSAPPIPSVQLNTHKASALGALPGGLAEET